MPAKEILVSNDAELLSVLENSYFKREGFSMLLVRDCEQAFQLTEAEAPVLAILDLAQLGEGGLVCCRRIKEDPLLNPTPVMLVLPDNAAEDLADTCWATGCDAVVHRPLPTGRLLESACSLLGISRRLARRFPVNFTLAFQANDRQRHAGTAVNLNAGGLFLETGQLFTVDTRLELEFTLPGLQTPLQCRVRVAWVNHPEWRKKTNLPCGMGVQFVDLNETAKAALDEFLGSLSVGG